MKNDFFGKEDLVPIVFYFIEGLPKENENKHKRVIRTSDFFSTNSLPVSNFCRPISKIITDYDIDKLIESGTK